MVFWEARWDNHKEKTSDTNIEMIQPLLPIALSHVGIRGTGTILPERARVSKLIFFYGEEQSNEKHARIFMVTSIFASSVSNGQFDRAADKLGDDHIARCCATSGHC